MHRKIAIKGDLGPIEHDVELHEVPEGWAATLLPRPGLGVSRSITAPTVDEALAQLAEVAQRDHEKLIEDELRNYGPRVPQP